MKSEGILEEATIHVQTILISKFQNGDHMYNGADPRVTGYGSLAPLLLSFVRECKGSLFKILKIIFNIVKVTNGNRGSAFSMTPCIFD